MTTDSANATPHERMELRDGIFFYQKLSRRHGAIAIAAPKYCVEVVHRAEHRRLRRVSDEATVASVFFAFLEIPFVASAMFQSDLSSILVATGLVLLLAIFFAANVVRWPLRNGVCLTEIVVRTDRRPVRIVFSRVQGVDPELESLLDHLQRFEPRDADSQARGCVVELAKSIWDRVRFAGYAIACLIAGLGFLLDFDENLVAGSVFVLAAMGISISVVLSAAFNRPLSLTMRTARAALLDGNLDTTALVLNKVLEKRPYHAYANYLMTAHALSTGDLEAAARHRAAMNGPTGRERLSVILADLTRVLSSAPAFRRLADHAGNGVKAGLEVLRKVSP